MFATVCKDVLKRFVIFFGTAMMVCYIFLNRYDLYKITFFWRGGGHFSILMFDMDFIKTVNLLNLSPVLLVRCIYDPTVHKFVISFVKIRF